MVGWKSLLQKAKPRHSADSNLDLEEYEALAVPSGLEATSSGSANASATGQPLVNGATGQVWKMPLVTDEDQARARAKELLLPEEMREYYFPDMDKDIATDALYRRPVGTFLLRRSMYPQAEYTLSVRSQRHVFNVRIFKRVQRGAEVYHLDAPAQMRKCFPSMSALLQYYSEAPRELVALCVDRMHEKGAFKLMHPLSRSEHALDRIGIRAGGDASRNPQPPRIVARQTHGSLKAMVEWL